VVLVESRVPFSEMFIFCTFKAIIWIKWLPLCFSTCEAYLLFDNFNLFSQSFYAMTNYFFSTFFSRAVSCYCSSNWYSNFFSLALCACLCQCSLSSVVL
jgi:hypothetical protein